MDGAMWVQFRCYFKQETTHALFLYCSSWISPKTTKSNRGPEARSKRSLPSTSMCFWGRLKIEDDRPASDWLISETAELKSTKLDRKQDFNVLYKVVFVGR